MVLVSAEVREARLVRGRDQGGIKEGGEGEVCKARSWFRDICPAWSVARMDWTVLMAEVVGDVEASLSRSVLGLEECLSLEQVGLLGISDWSHEQFGEQGGS